VVPFLKIDFAVIHSAMSNMSDCARLFCSSGFQIGNTNPAQARRASGAHTQNPNKKTNTENRTKKFALEGKEWSKSYVHE